MDADGFTLTALALEKSILSSNVVARDGDIKSTRLNHGKTRPPQYHDASYVEKEKIMSEFGSECQAVSSLSHFW